MAQQSHQHTILLILFVSTCFHKQLQPSNELHKPHIHPYQPKMLTIGCSTAHTLSHLFVSIYPQGAQSRAAICQPTPPGYTHSSADNCNRSQTLTYHLLEQFAALQPVCPLPGCEPVVFNQSPKHCQQDWTTHRHWQQYWKQLTVKVWSAWALLWRRRPQFSRGAIVAMSCCSHCVATQSCSLLGCLSPGLSLFAHPFGSSLCDSCLQLSTNAVVEILQLGRNS